MCRKSLRLPEFLGGLGGRALGKSKGRPRKPLAEVYSQGRPVARHFVCASCCIRHAIPNYLKVRMQRAFRAVGIATGRERFNLTGAGTRFAEVLLKSDLVDVPTGRNSGSPKTRGYLEWKAVRIEKNGDPGGSRTPNPQIRSLMLYPVELRGQVVL